MRRIERTPSTGLLLKARLLVVGVGGRRVGDVGHEEQRTAVLQLDQQRVMPDRVPGRVEQVDALGELDVALEQRELRARVVEALVGVAEPLERLGCPRLAELVAVQVGRRGAQVLVAAAVVEVAGAS